MYGVWLQPASQLKVSLQTCNKHAIGWTSIKKFSRFCIQRRLVGVRLQVVPRLWLTYFILSDKRFETAVRIKKPIQVSHSHRFYTFISMYFFTSIIPNLHFPLFAWSNQVIKGFYFGFSLHISNLFFNSWVVSFFNYIANNAYCNRHIWTFH